MTESEMDQLFHALSHEIRRRILDILRDRPGSSVGEIAKAFDVSRIAVMNHLTVLEKAGLTVSEKDTRSRRLYLNAAPIQIIHDRWISDYSGHWSHKIVSLKFAAEAAVQMSAGNDKSIYRVRIAAPIETVWSILVKTDDVLPFFFGAVCRTPSGLRPGAPLAMRTKSGAYTAVVGKVLEFLPPHRYAHTLKFTGLDEAPATVTYELKEVDGGVEFTLTTTGAPAMSKTGKSMAQGGPYIVKTLKAIAESGRPGLGARLMLTIIGLTERLNPKVSRSEHWTFDRIAKL
jgi:DNA-binding transcriptional ArsR family regulator/uncharacterized protein YndB with AHSA1/START domain